MRPKSNVFIIEEFLMRSLFFYTFIVACAGAVSAQAQSVTKPGLWEASSTMSSPTNPQMTKQMEEVQKAMANMPPAQRKQMEEMMAKQGFSMSAGSGGATVMKMCVSNEMASRPPVEQRQGCTYNFNQRGNVHNFNYKCTNPPSDGEGEIVFNGSDAYNGKMRLNSLRNGKKETIDIVTNGKFLGANCGNIKPMVIPKG
jgi:hypothetical protein